MLTTRTIHPDLRTVADAVEVIGPSTYVVLGEIRKIADPRTPLLPALADDLYSRLYLRPSPHDAPSADWRARREWMNALSTANHGTGTWEPGWTVRRIDDDGRIVVFKDDLCFWVPPTGLRVDAGAVEPGAGCRVRIPKELRDLRPGYYNAFGDASGDDPKVPDRTVRVYWHLKPEAGVRLVAELTLRLNAARVSFRLKVLSDPGTYLRADAGVLYLARRDFDRYAAGLVELAEALGPGLRPDVPLFTRRLANGLGLADDPGDGQSFGESRCRLAATGLWRSAGQGRDARVAALADAFEQAGIDPARPDLQLSSA